jgi:hypothetical protein
MLAFKRSLLNREYNLMNVLKALASIISMCNLHVILLSNNTPRYFTLFTNGIFRPFNLKSGIRRSISMSEIDRLSLVFIDFNIPAFTPGRHRVEPTLDLSQNIASHIDMCRPQRELSSHRGFGGYH